jgi:hypothetical protein
MKTIIILIDCWYRFEQFLPFHCDRTIYKNIIKFVDNSVDIDTVCLSSYNCNNEYMSDDHWYGDIKNKKDKFQEYKNYNNVIFKNKKSEHTSPLILNWKPNKNTIAAHDVKDLPDTIQNVFLCGKAFDICVSKQPIGIYRWMTERNVNVFIKNNCVLNSKGKFPNLKDNPCWELVNDDIYKCIELDKTIEPWSLDFFKQENI